MGQQTPYEPFKNGDSTYNCSVFGKHHACGASRSCGCECHEAS